MIGSLLRSEGRMMPLTTVAVFVTLTSFAIAQDNPPGKAAAPAPEFDVTSSPLRGTHKSNAANRCRAEAWSYTM